MNERIKELAEQASLYARSDNSSMLFENYHNRYTDKFAELIVRECVQVCADRGTHHDGLYSAWADDCSKRIGKHFGVEE
jgi:hypothetical protein